MNTKWLVVTAVLLMIFLVVGCSSEQDEEQETESDEQVPSGIAPAPIPAQQPIQAQPEVQQAPPAPVVAPSLPPPLPLPTPQPTLPLPIAEQTVAQPPPQQDLSGYIDPQVARLIARQDKAKSYHFYYSTSENWNVIRDQFFIKGDKIKIGLYEINRWNNDYFDTVYLDPATKTAEAFCENNNKERCRDNDRKFDVSYEDFIIKTPLEWLTSIPRDAKVTGSENFDERMSVVVEYTRDDGATVRIWIDRFSGVPVRVLIFMDEVENILEQYNFKNLVINTLTSQDVVHQYDTFQRPT